MSSLPESSAIPVDGFRFAGLSAGIKRNGNPDLALAVADEPAVIAGVLTTNIVRAAPVLVTAERLARGKARAVLANSGCANACTGAPGLEATHKTTSAIAQALGAREDEVFPASTGVIGALLPSEKILTKAPELVAALSPNGGERFAEAIMTTDRAPKLAHVRGEIGGRPFSMMGIAKGAGMIHPSMAPALPHATMLAFLFTDAAASPRALERALARAADETFNSASVDGDTSTNDTLLALASGRAGTAPGGDELPPALYEAILAVSESLARQMVADGEGSQHLVELHVSGTESDAEARMVARTIATSPLVKTAIFGKDPNWGRILAAAGRAGVRFDPDRASIRIGEVTIVERGMSIGSEAERRAHEIMTGPSFRIDVTLGQGPGRGRYLMCDLGIDYVRCNADYRS